MELKARRLHLRLFIEGIEIPIISCVVQATINQPAVCTVQIVPLHEINEFKPRCMMHVFFYDFTDDRTVDLQDIKRYKLLFSGETIGHSFSASGLGRQAVLSAADFSSNWTKAYQYMITYGPSGNVLTPAATNYAAGSDKFNNIIDSHMMVLAAYLNSTPKSPGFRSIKGLLGGILVLIEQFGGVIGHRRGHNDFFTYQELRCKIMQQIVAEENDNTANQLFQAKEFYEWLEDSLAKLGELCTLNDMISLLFQYIYYERVPVPSPLFKRGNAGDKYVDTIKVNDLLNEIAYQLEGRGNLDEIKINAQTALKQIALVKQYENLDKTQIKNLQDAENLIKGIQDVKQKNKAVLANLAKAKKLVLDTIKKVTDTELKKIEVDKLNTIIFKPECYFVSPPRCNIIFPDHNTQWNYARNHETEYTRLRLQSGMIFDLDKEQLLADFCYAPAGPEVDRLAKEQGGGRLGSLLPWEKFTGVLPKFEYISELNYVASKKQKELQKDVQKLARSYKTRAANFNFYKYRFLSRSLTGSCRFNPFLVAGFPLAFISEPFIVDKEQLIERAREKGTELNEIKTQDVIDNIKELAKELNAPTHYIGYVTTLSHTIDQSGASTSFSCSHARPHRTTNDEYLEIYKDTAQKAAGKQTFKTFLDIDDLISKGDAKLITFLKDLTPQNPPTTTQQSTIINDRPKLSIDGLDVLSPSFRTKSNDKFVEYVGETTDQEVLTGKIKVPTNSGKLKVGDQGLFGNITTIRVINDIIKKVVYEGKEIYAWKTLLVYEEKDTTEVLKPIPLEEVLRPSWFSPNYSNLLIGEQIYQKFIGTGALVDEVVFKDPNGLSIQGAKSNRIELLNKLAESKDLLSDTEKLTQSKLFETPSVEEALDVLAFQYGELVRQNLDAERFITDYTYREIANIEDILGSEDLEFRVSGKTLERVNGIQGFHSVAVANYDNLLGLLQNPDLPLPNRISSRNISGTIDVRKERREKILEYYNKVNQTGEIIAFKG